MRTHLLWALTAALAVSIPAPAATFTVVNTNAAGAGSLQQAMLEANASPGADIIAFNIASGGLTISLTNALPEILEPLTLDGSTQPGFAGSPIIELNGAGAGAATDGLRIVTSNSVVRAVIINRFLGDGLEITNGANNTIQGCYLGLNRAGLTDQGNTLNGILITNAANNLIGGLEATNRNYIAGNNQSGIHLGGALATANLLLGNFIGLNITGSAIVNSVDGVRVNAPQTIIGGSAPGSRNFISGNTGQGIEITPAGGGSMVRGNYIGTDTTGTVDRGNSVDGMLVSAAGVIIGGANAGEGNLISGNNGDGIELNGTAATNSLVLGNIIGADVSGLAGVPNTGNGVLLTTSAQGNVVGGVLGGEANTIAFNGGAGISVAAAVANTNNTFRGNAIFSNVGLGLDLGAAGATLNDAGDADTGANQLQNFPVLTAVSNTATEVVIAGSLNSRPSTLYALDFYSSPVADATGQGEGQYYLGSASLATGADSNLTFNLSFALALPGRYVTATATDPSGNTSEFSAAAAAKTTVPGQTFTVSNTNDAGAGSLREAINQANLAVTAGDTIVFAITNPATTISPSSALPPVADVVTIDGYTQSGAAVNTSPTLFNGTVPVRLAGNSAGTGADGLLITAGQSTVRGLMITGFNGDGIELSGFGGNVIEGCVLGLSAAGADLGNTGNGISISGSSSNRVGGTAPAARNVIAANNSDGIEISGAAAVNNVVRGNLIGTTFNGTTGLANTGNGVLLTTSAQGNVVGGVLGGEANTIAFNGGAGISVAAAVANTNNTFRGNAIFSNVGLGLDLGAAGATLNDAGDADTGANQLQNFPVLTAVSNTATEVVIAGSLNSRPSTPYALDFYSSPVADATGQGEGQYYLGSASLATGADSNLTFNLSFALALPGRYVTATATDPSGNTSEFSAAAAAKTTVPGQTFTVSNTNDAGAGSLREAINQANLAVTAGDTIVFAITNPATTISPSSALPPVADVVTIDGYTQSGAAVNTSPTLFNGTVPVRLAGNSAGTGADGLLITAGQSTVRGLMITGFNGDGIELSGFGGNVIEGCVLGLSAAGADLGNTGNGISISGSSSNRVGGTAPAARNVIAANNSDGIEISGAAAVNNVVRGNLIGTTFNGTTGLANTGNGVLLTTSAQGNVVGGVLGGEANTIAFNGGAGISVAAAVANTNNTFRGNAIFSNVGLGLDLGAAGATLNDAGDADTGANQLQNFPVLTAATTNSPSQVVITGLLASAASTRYDLDFYANASLDLSGHGEGEFYLGSTSLTTDGSGRADFAVALATGLPGRYISATATDPSGNTSEFSRWVVAVSSNPSTNTSILTADFVFIIDASSSMGGEIAAVKSGLGSFVTGLNTASIDARFAIVLFGGAPELIFDWTTDQTATEAAFDLINVNNAVSGIQNNHNVNPEAGLEAIRVVLNSAPNSTLLRNNVGGAGPLVFRPEARKNLIVVTDEDSDLPFYAENREAGQTGTEPPSPLTAAWQAEINTTAQAVITNNAYVNLLVSPSGIIRNQYGDPAQSAADANFLNFNPDGTLTNLITAGFGNSLEAQVLTAGLLGRAFNITSVNTANFVQNFFAAKVEEIIHNQPRPRLNVVLLPGGPGAAVRLTWPTNSSGFLLETNHSLILTNGWGVLTTNYSIIGTNYAVTNSVSDALRFYRLRR